VTPERWQEVERLYHAALPRTPSERDAWLSHECAGDDGLRREVESLLAQASKAGDFLDTPALVVAARELAAGSRPLLVGRTFGPYTLLSLLGAGGMGEVYRAHDTKLNRDVALKFLPATFTDDPERLARFRREAQVLAALNHPHIGAIYGLDDANGQQFLVLELVDGESLDRRITRGPIPVDEALSIAQQIAEALEAAHEKGIIHRDLKPANIALTNDGNVKVLDFGLAKATEVSAGAADPRNSPTITSPAMRTGAGVILGTAAYMSPEQAAGKAVDKRSDLWAFGVVVLEMLTGRPVFSGETVSHVLASVLTSDPDWTMLPASTPASIRRLLRRCLEKDRKRRLESAADARLEIEEARAPIGEVGAVSVAIPVAPWRRAMPWGVAGAAVAGLMLMLMWSAPWRAEKPVDRPLVRLDVDLGADVSLGAPSTGGSSVAISRDGTRLVYASGTPTKLFTRRLDQPKATELPGTQGASKPFFSPDSQWVGFVGGNKLNKISVEGGAVVPLQDVGSGITIAGASWSEDGSILVSQVGKGLVRIPAGGGPPETIVELGTRERALARPQLLPGGKAILFVATTSLGVDTYTIEVVTLADRHRKIVVRGGHSPRYVPTPNGAGHVIYANKATLFAVPFDLERLETRGTAVPVLDDVAFEASTGVAQFDVSETGTLVYRRASGGASALTTLQWVDPTGKKEPLRAKPGAYQFLSLSPDGKRVALVVAEGGSQDVWVYDPRRDAMTRLTSGGTIYRTPLWTPDGQYVVFTPYGDGILQARADGTSQPRALTQGKFQIPWSFTPDGKRLAYFEIAASIQIWTVPLEDHGGQLRAGKPELFLKSRFTDVDPSFSPDGRWLAYQSDESGTDEVYVRPFPPPSSGQGGKWQISNNGGRAPRWPRNGHELVYQSGDQMMAASYTVNGDTFVAEQPRVWIPKLGATVIANMVTWDLAPDGTRVAVVAPVEPAEASKEDHEVVFLLNFFDELRRRVPTKH
jgi:serine/threonine-protein kinase